VLAVVTSAIRGVRSSCACGRSSRAAAIAHAAGEEELVGQLAEVEQAA
jgi:hypothetical protein